MAAGSVGSTSTYSGNLATGGFSFSKTVASKVLDAAVAAKQEKRVQDKIISDGGTVPENQRKGLFAKALRQEFIGSPVSKLKKSFNKKLESGARIASIFGKPGEKVEQALLKKRVGVRTGFDRSKYKTKQQPSGDSDGSGGSGGSGSVSAFGELVLDIQQIASSVATMSSLLNTQLGLSYKMSGSLAEIRNVLTEQLSLQKERISSEELAAKEASLESSQQTSGSTASTSTYGNTLFGGAFGFLGQLQSLFGMLQNLPTLFKGMFKGLLEKLPLGRGLASKLFGQGAKAAGGELAEKGTKSLLAKMVGKFLKPIPIVGGLLDFAINLALGEPVGRAAAKAVGSLLGAGLGSLIPIPGVGTIAGAVLGDWVGGSLYDWISGMFSSKQTKLSQGGVMLGEAGTEMVTPLNSAQGREFMGGSGLDPNLISEVYSQPYNAVAGGMLSITKDFVENLGPIGQSVAPTIQEDVDRLGKNFDLPSTLTTFDVGGPKLRTNPNAEKEGKTYLENLVEGSLEKIAPKKEENKKSSSGGSTGTSPSEPPSDEDSSSPDASNPSPSSPSPKSPQVKTTGEIAADTLKTSNAGVSPTYEVVDGVARTTDKFQVSDSRLQPVKFDNGMVSEGYYYDAYGNIYQIKSDGTKRTVSNDKKLLNQGAYTGLNVKKHTFQRNLQTGQVRLAANPTVGYYDYASNSVFRNVPKQSGRASSAYEVKPVHVSKFDPKGQQFNAANPYGPVKVTQGVQKSNSSGARTGAESGAKIDLWATSRAGNTKLSKDSTFENTKQHAHRPGPSERGWPRDYAIVQKGTDPVANPSAGKGEPVVAGVSGTVTTASDWESNAGNTVQISNGTGRNSKLLATFHHFDKIKTKVGSKVSPSTVIGTQGNTGTKDIHVHLEGDKDVHTKWIKSQLGGSYSSDDYLGDGADDTLGEQSTDPFEAMDKAIERLGVSLGLLSQAGTFKSKEDYKALESELKSAASSGSTNAPPQAEDKATSPAHFRQGSSPVSPSESQTQQPAAKPAAPVVKPPSPSTTPVPPAQGSSPTAFVSMNASPSPSSPVIQSEPDSTIYGYGGSSTADSYASRLYTRNLLGLA